MLWYCYRLQMSGIMTPLVWSWLIGQVKSNFRQLDHCFTSYLGCKINMALVGFKAALAAFFPTCTLQHVLFWSLLITSILSFFPSLTSGTDLLWLLARVPAIFSVCFDLLLPCDLRVCMFIWIPFPAGLSICVPTWLNPLKLLLSGLLVHLLLCPVHGISEQIDSKSSS